MGSRISKALAALTALLGGCQCGFDAGKLDRIACADDSDCAPDQSCEGDLCVQRRCVVEVECGDGWDFTCDEGFCVADTCGENDVCKEGFECSDEGFCRASQEEPCEGSSDCAPDEDCEDVCVPRPCDEATDCGEGWAFTCEAGSCAADACIEVDPCEDGFECSEDGWCRERQPECELDSDCAPDQDCEDDRCVSRPCDEAADCGEGWSFTCDAGFCVADSCSGDDPCEDGFECSEEGFCREVEPECELDVDCRDGLYCNGRETCVFGTCVDGIPPNCSNLEVGPCEVAQCDEAKDACLVAGEDCDDGLDCTTDSCNEDLTCTNALDPGFCLIDGACISAGDDPEDQCRLCDPELDPEEWTSWTGACDDGQSCTWQDSCESGACAGELYSCDDFHDCTVDTCDGNGGCQNVVAEGVCLIDGECRISGDRSPENQCLACIPVDGQDRWTAGHTLPCDDADPCTEDDACQAGVCEGSPYDCDDGLSCTAGECDGEGGCLASIMEGHCLIEGTCRDYGELNPANPCQECDPDSDQDSWTNDDTNSPSDGIDCTIDACAGGVESHQANDASCPDAGQTCMRCAGGCVTIGPVTVSCPDAPTAPGPPGATCTISTATPGIEQCLRCRTAIGITSLISDTFDGCPNPEDLGWDVEGPLAACPAIDKLGPDVTIREDQLVFKAPEVGRLVSTAKQGVSTTGFDSVRLCFDYADLAAGLDDFLAVYLNTGMGYQLEWSDAVGPIGASDLVWLTTCLDLVELQPAAADNSLLGVMIAVDVGGGNSTIFLDNIMLDAWDSDFIGRPGPVSTADFTGCDLGGWVPGAVDPVCPIDGGANDGREALEADDSAWRISQTFDISDRCEDITVAFNYGTRNVTPPMNEDDRGAVSFDFGQGETLAWGALGRTGSNETFQAFQVYLSHMEPDVRFQPDLQVTFELIATDPDNNLYLDDISIDGATCESGDELLIFDQPVDEGGGQYSLTISSPTQATAYLTCNWAGEGETADLDQVIFEE